MGNRCAAWRRCAVVLRSTAGAVMLMHGSAARADDAGAEVVTSDGNDEDSELAAALAADLASTPSAVDPAGTPTNETGGGPAAAAGPAALNPSLSVIATFALAAFSDEERALQSGGHDPTSNGFNLQGLELTLGTAVDPYFRLDATLVFAGEGVELEEAYGTTLGLPARLQLRAGQFLAKVGRVNAQHLHAWDFADQPFPVGRVLGGEGLRGLGLETSWLAPLPWFVEVAASATTPPATSHPHDGEPAEETPDSARSVDGPSDLAYVVTLRQFFDLSDDWSLLWGLTGATWPGEHAGERAHVLATDLYLKWRPITRESTQIVALQTEWFGRRRRSENGAIRDLSGYASVLWRFAARWTVAARYELGTPARDAAGTLAEDEEAPDFTANRHRAAASLSFIPTEFSRLRLQGSVDLPRWLDAPSYAGFLTLELVGGAHGAHAF